MPPSPAEKVSRQGEDVGKEDGKGALTRGTDTRKSLVVGIDGATYACLAEADMPHLSRLMAAGMTATSNLYAAPMAATNSGPGWSSIATGTWPDKHNVVKNFFLTARFSAYPDYLTRLSSAQPLCSTVVVGTWGPISRTIFGPAVDVRVNGGNDAGTTARAVDQLAKGNPGSTFVHLDDVDGAGHGSGTGSAAYRDALATADGRLGEILDAVTSRPTYREESWLVIVTADHGHTSKGGHGGSSPAERQVFVVARGPGIPAGSVRHDVRIVDIAPTVLQHHGVTAERSWGLDGRVFPAVPDAFDELRGSLRGSVDQISLPVTLPGWTDTPPSGWTIDNSRMPAGGVTEWRGWSFATDEFWTTAAPGHGRETSVRNRGVFAVADPAAWAAGSRPAQPFDSTLLSPVFAVTGGRAALLEYATHYRGDGSPAGEVSISYDGGPPEPVTSYRAEVNALERLPVAVPGGVTSARLGFRLSASNTAFWTVDQVVLSGGVRTADR